MISLSYLIRINSMNVISLHVDTDSTIGTIEIVHVKGTV